MTAKGWNEEDVARLTELVTKTSLTYSQIGQMLGRTKNECLGKARRMLLERPGDKNQPQRRSNLEAAKPRKRPTRDEAPPPLPRKLDGGCRWIEGHPQPGVEVVFCGETIARGSYCEAHAKRCYTAPSGRTA